MKVKELIEKLRTFDEDLECKDYDGNNITEVYILTYSINKYRKKEESELRIV